MKFILNIFTFFIIVFSNFCIKAETMDRINDNRNAGIEYRVIKDNTHVIHILEIDPKYYRLELVKAHNSVFGRETVPQIAERKGATAAINAGFFEIGGEDGRPSGNLIIDGKILALAQDYQSSLILDNDNIDITRIRSNAKIKYSSGEINVKKVNQFTHKDDVVLYNSLWGSTTLTPYKDRLEFVLDEDNMVVQALEHGDSKIPSSGWVLSLPSSHKLASIGIGDKLIVDISFEQQSTNAERPIHSSIMGIPILVDEGKIWPGLETLGRGGFIMQPHARTAIGFKADGTIVMVVAEHLYTRPIKEVNLGQVQAILRQKGYGDKLTEISIAKALVLVRQEIQAENSAVGLTIPELAQIMLDLGCVKALNLDGGGSSTMFLNGQVVNTTVGDSDESMGQKVVRHVSDAVVLIKR